MESGSVTTPFGRRTMSLGLFARQVASRKIEPGKSIDKWKLYRALCEAKPLLGVTDRALAVLNALLSFYPHNELSEEHGLVVFPSNAQLSLRAHGMAEQTIRRHVSHLVGAGLLIRRDSPNGKRYARKSRSGDIYVAYGFSLAPLLARSLEIEQLAAKVVAERLHLQHLRERWTLCRRDVVKLVETALQEKAEGDWPELTLDLQELTAKLPRVPTIDQLETALHELELLREDVVKQLELQLKSKKESGNPCQNERHIKNSHTESLTESEPCLENDRMATTQIVQSAPQSVPQRRDNQPNRENSVSSARGGDPQSGELRSFPLALVLQACPQISDYAPGGRIGNWRDLMSASVVVRTMLQVSPSAYQEACLIMGPANAAAVMACILEKGENINSAGGYLRDLTRRSERGEFGLGPMLMALLRANGQQERLVS